MTRRRADVPPELEGELPCHEVVRQTCQPDDSWELECWCGRLFVGERAGEVHKAWARHQAYAKRTRR